MDTPSFVSFESRPPSPGQESVPFEHMVKEWTAKEASRHAKRTQGFCLIPRELVFIIMKHLEDPVDQTCLALTTKELWICLQSSLDLTQFILRGVLPTRVNEKQGIIKHWPYFASPRWRLLERLEDSYWKCCAGCLHLQPKRDFARTELFNDPRNRFCRVPGLFQVCPHILLTLKKCEKLQAALCKAIGISRSRPGEGSRAPTITMDHLAHQCVFESKDTIVTCMVQPKISGRRKHLSFVNQYTVSDFSIQNMKAWMSQFGHDALLTCPHRNITTHVLDMLHQHRYWSDEMRVQGLDPRSQTTWCKFCWTHYYQFETSESSPLGTRTISFLTQRHFGNGWHLRNKRIESFDDVRRIRDWLHRTDLANILNVAEDRRGGTLKWFFSRRKTWRRGDTSLPTMPWKR